jgi:ABC-type antimicrobial peptide transport system permease subunit
MFIIAAALLLVWLLFRLGVEQRASEIGTLLALGWRRSKVGWLLLAEGSLVAALGAAFGVAAGVGYAWLMLAGLRTWWVGAIVSPFLTLYIGSLSLVLGFSLGLLVSAGTIWFSLRGLRNSPVRELMAGMAASVSRRVAAGQVAGRWWQSWALRGGLFIASFVLAIFATKLGGEAQAGAFLTAGALVLALLLLWTADRLRDAGMLTLGGVGGGSLLTLAVRNAGRNVGRSITTIALMASAAFLIVAVSSFRLSPTDEGTGGFNLLAESSEPVIADLNSATGRRELFAGEAGQLDGTTTLSLRLQPGDDASCRNLYKATQPRILGVSPAFIEHFSDLAAARFAFAASAASAPDVKENPWRLLASATSADQPIPVILDKNTAMYSLQKYGGIGEEFEFTYGDTPIRFRVVGLLANSVLQGSLLIGESDFTRLFPNTSGYRSFLIRTPADREHAVATLLESRLSDEGFDTVDARSRLADLLAVQNTYISTFQSLGAIGLLLGTFGLAAVQLRSVFERRKELALLRAAGFRRWRLATMVLLENLLLLVGGLAAGSLAALAAVLPHMLASGAQVPLADLAVMLGIVLVVGTITGLVAVRATLRAPLVAALRGE